MGERDTWSGGMSRSSKLFLHETTGKKSSKHSTFCPVFWARSLKYVSILRNKEGGHQSRPDPTQGAIRLHVAYLSLMMPRGWLGLRCRFFPIFSARFTGTLFLGCPVAILESIGVATDVDEKSLVTWDAPTRGRTLVRGLVKAMTKPGE